MKVKHAEYIEAYKIKIIFSDGVTKLVDFAAFLKSAKNVVFLPLRDIDYFKQFQVDDITLSWPNGADFDPELLYDMGTMVKVKSLKRATRGTSAQPARTRKRLLQKNKS